MALAQKTATLAQASNATNTWVVWSPPTSYLNTATLGANVYTYATTVTGSAVLPNSSTVYVRLTGEIVNPSLSVNPGPGDCNTSYGGGPSGFAANSTTCPTYWSGGAKLKGADATSFTSANIPSTTGTNGDKIGLIGIANGGEPNQTLEFFSDAAMTTTTSVSNLTMLMYSVGNASSIRGEWRFDQDFAILSHNKGTFRNGFTGGGLRQYSSADGYLLTGSEGSGAIQFTGTFDELSWTVMVPEAWASWQVGFTSANPPAGSLDMTCAVPPLASGESRIVGGTTVTATDVSAVAVGSDYLFQNSVRVSATLEFSPPIPAFRAVTANHADVTNQPTNFEEFRFTATSSASTPVHVTTSALRNIDGTFNYLPGVSLSAMVSTLTVDYLYDGNAGTEGARGSYLRLFLNCSTLSPIPGTRALQVGTAIGPVYMSQDGFGGAITYAITGGTLPAGLSLDPNTGTITGTPTSGVASTVTISATGAAWGFNTTTVTFTGTAAPTVDTPPPADLPPGVAPLINTPVTPPTKTPPTTTVPTTTPSPTTTLPPLPVREPSGALPTAEPGSSIVTEDAAAVEVVTFIDNGQAFVVRGQDFELRLAGQCTTDCTISADSNGRETLVLQRDGGARVTGFGFKPGTLVHVWIFSEPRYLGALLVDANGDYAGTFPLEGIAVGEHTLQVNGTSFDDKNRTANLGIIVFDAAAPTPQPGQLPATGTSTGPMVFLAALLPAIAGLVGMARRRLGAVAPR